MLDTDLFKVEEIGICKSDSTIFLKGRKKSFLGEEKELAREISPLPNEFLKNIDLLTDGVSQDEAGFIRNVYEMAGFGVKELTITSKGRTEPHLRNHYAMAKLRFSKNGSISEVLPQVGLMHFLASRDIGNGEDTNGGIIYSDQDLGIFPEMYTHRMGNNLIKFKRIRDIKIRDERHATNIEENKYERFKFLGVLINSDIPDTLVYENGSKKIGFKFPESKVTFENARRLGSPTIRVNDPYNPFWLADSITVIDEIIRRAQIEVGPIYVDGELKNYRSMDFFRYEPSSAKIVFKRNERRIITLAPSEYAKAMSFLHTKDICVRDPTKDYIS